MNREGLIKKLKERIGETKNKLEKRRMDMEGQDGPMQSIGITATRWMVEQEIESLDKELARLINGLREIQKIITEERRWTERYFVSQEFECTELGIISEKTKIGKEILNLKA